MKYFLKELWLDMQQSDPEVRNKANLIWEQNSKNYQEFFKTICHRIPKRFRTAYLQHHGFHDYEIKGISFSGIGQKSVCTLNLFSGTHSFFLRLYGIHRVHIDIPSFEGTILGRLSWGYAEFELTEDDIIQLSILCDLECELTFAFEKIALCQ